MSSLEKVAADSTESKDPESQLLVEARNRKKLRDFKRSQAIEYKSSLRSFNGDCITIQAKLSSGEIGSTILLVFQSTGRSSKNKKYTTIII